MRLTWSSCLVGLSLCACDPAEELEFRSAGVYVGAAEDTDLAIGVAVAGDKIRIYACGGAANLADSRWFKGDLGDGPFELNNGAWSIDGAWVDGHLEGELHTPDGDVLAWSADPAAPGTGVYAATTGACTSGVIIRQADDGPPTAQGTWCDGQGHLAQIIVLPPFAASARGILVGTRPPRDGRAPATRPFYVTAVVP